MAKDCWYPDEINEVIKHLADKRYLNITALQANIHDACSECAL